MNWPYCWLRRRLRAAAAVPFIALFSAAAAAQDLGDDGLTRDQTIAYGAGLKNWDSIKKYGAERVIDRDRTPFMPDGVRAGNYTMFPSIGTTAVFDDNIFFTSKDRVSDIRFEIVPVVRAKSDFARHILDFSVSAKQTEYVKHNELNSTDGKFTVDGALHFDNAHTLSLSLLSAYEHEDRAAPDAPMNAAERTPVFHNRIVAGIKRDAGRMWASFSTSVERWDFQDVKARNGTTIDQDNRDTQIVSAQAQLGYRFSPGFEVQGKLRALRQWNFHPGSTDFSADGLEATAGVVAEISPLLRWRLMGGYGVRDYDSSQLKLAGNALAEAELQWLPTQLMTVYATARRAYAEGIYGDGAGGRIDNSVGIRAEYEALRNLVFTIGGEYRESEYFSQNRRDQVLIGRIGAEYYYTKNWLFSVAYEHHLQSSNVAEDNITRNRVWLGSKLRF